MNKIYSDINVQLLHPDELVKIDSKYKEIIEEFTNQTLQAREFIILQRVMVNLLKENKELKNEIERLKREYYHSVCSE